MQFLWGILGTPLALLLGAIGTYVAFQKKLLPIWAAKWVARLAFWPTIPLTLMNKEFYTTIDASLALGTAPLGKPFGHVRRLDDNGVTGVINLCDEYRGPLREYGRYGIRQLWLPVVDHTEPELAYLERSVAFIDAQARSGGKVFVHCKGGHGRSAAVAMAWLLFSRPGEDIRDLQLELSGRRKVRKTLYSQPNIVAYQRRLRLKAAARDPDEEDPADFGATDADATDADAIQLTSVGKKKRKGKKKGASKRRSTGSRSLLSARSAAMATIGKRTSGDYTELTDDGGADDASVATEDDFGYGHVDDDDDASTATAATDASALPPPEEDSAETPLLSGRARKGSAGSVLTLAQEAASERERKKSKKRKKKKVKASSAAAAEAAEQRL